MIHVLVASNQSIRVFEAKPGDPRLEELAVFRNQDLGRHERDLVRDRPGRVVDGGSGIHHAYEPKIRARDHSTQRWLKVLGAPLQEFLTSRQSDALVLVAAPRTLAQVRGRLPTTLTERIQAELPRDLGRERPAALSNRLQPTLRAVWRKMPRREPIYRPSSVRGSYSRTPVP